MTPIRIFQHMKLPAWALVFALGLPLPSSANHMKLVRGKSSKQTLTLFQSGKYLIGMGAKNRFYSMEKLSNGNHRKVEELQVLSDDGHRVRLADKRDGVIEITIPNIINGSYFEAARKYQNRLAKSVEEATAAITQVRNILGDMPFKGSEAIFDALRKGGTVNVTKEKRREAAQLNLEIPDDALPIGVATDQGELEIEILVHEKSAKDYVPLRLKQSDILSINVNKGGDD